MEKRLILYIDILGFKDLCSRRSAYEVYKEVNSYVEIAKLFEGIPGNEVFKDISKGFSIIYFADTIILWQKDSDSPQGIYDLLIYSALIYLFLLARKIPIRGAITYGEFIVKKDKSDEHDIFVGEALIRAYEMENKGRLIGIEIDTPVAKFLSENPIRDNEGKHHDYSRYWLKRRRKENVFLLNPFADIDINKVEELKPEGVESKVMSNALHAFKFLLDSSKKDITSDFTSKEAKKYLKTLKYLQVVMGKENYLKIVRAIEKTNNQI